MGRYWRRQLIRNQNTQRTAKRNGNKSRQEGCGKIHENVLSVHSVAALSQHNTFKYIRIIYNVHNILENSHMLSTHKLILAAECTEDYNIHRCNPLYYKWP